MNSIRMSGTALARLELRENTITKNLDSLAFFVLLRGITQSVKLKGQLYACVLSVTCS